MVKLLKINFYFFLYFLVYLITGGVILYCSSKGDIVLFLNSLHNDFSDKFFLWFTLLGSGWFFALLTILLAFYRLRYALLSLFCFLATTIITQALKHTIFSDSLRPRKLLQQATELNFVEGVNVHSFNSFPSGHTVTAFSIFCLLTLLINAASIKSPNYILGLLFFLMAFLVSISRIYLLQHFFVDTYFGAIIGVAITLICYHFFERSEKLTRNKVLNSSLVYHFKKMITR